MINLFHMMLKKDRRIGRIFWNRVRKLQCLRLPRHMLEVTSNYTDFLTLVTWVYVQQYTSYSTSILSLFHINYSLQNQELHQKGKAYQGWN